MNSSVTQWPLWMASPNGESAQTGAPNATSPWSTWELWQYGGGDIDGITGTVDEDVFDGTASQLTNTLVIGKAIAAPPSGVTVYWDPGLKDASPGSGGTGTWDNSSTNWWLSGTGEVVWSAAGDYAIFAGTGATVTLGADVGADGLTFDTPGYVISRQRHHYLERHHPGDHCSSRQPDLHWLCGRRLRLYLDRGRRARAGERRELLRQLD